MPGRYRGLTFGLSLSLIMHLLTAFGMALLKESNETVFISINIRSVKEKSSQVSSLPQSRGDNKENPAANEKTDEGFAEESLGPVQIKGADLGIQVVYPRLSRIKGEQGQVGIQVSQMQKPQILISSGYQRLDQAALEAVMEAQSQGHLMEVLLNRQRIQLDFFFSLKEQ